MICHAIASIDLPSFFAGLLCLPIGWAIIHVIRHIDDESDGYS